MAKWEPVNPQGHGFVPPSQDALRARTAGEFQERESVWPRLAFLQHDATETISYAAYTADDPGPLDFTLHSDEIVVGLGCTADLSASESGGQRSVRMSYRLTRLGDNTTVQDAADARSAFANLFVDLPVGDNVNTIYSINYQRHVTGLAQGQYRLQAYYKTASAGAGGGIQISNRFLSALHFSRGSR